MMIDFLSRWRRPRREPETLTAKIKRGHRGRWRFTLFGEDGEMLALAPVLGYKTFADAAAVARRVSPTCDVVYDDGADDGGEGEVANG